MTTATFGNLLFNVVTNNLDCNQMATVMRNKIKMRLFVCVVVTKCQQKTL